MMDTAKLKYTETHEWISWDGKTAVVGITDHAQHEISDIVFIELPKVGRQAKQKESVMVIESVKAAFDIYAPVSGQITRINDKVKDKPEIVNQSPYKEGWLYEMSLSNPAELESLLSEAQYKALSGSSAH